MVKTRLVAILLGLLAAIALLAGCGGGESAGDEPAGVAPPDTSVFVEATVQPQGSTREAVEAIAEKAAGIEDLGGTIVSKLEASARSNGEGFDFQTDVKPWLGERVGVFLTRFDGNDFKGNGLALEVTDAGEAREFLERQIEADSGPKPREASYEGVDYYVDPEDETAIGLVGNLFVYGSDEALFKEAVDASDGESLSDSDRYSKAVSAAPAGAFGNVYVDIGGLIKESGATIDPQTRSFLETAGLQVDEATALASLVPHSDDLELQLSSDLAEGGEAAPAAESLLESLPARSVAALAVSGFGDRIAKAVDRIDASGIPGQVPPNQLKSTLLRAGIDIDKITSNLDDAAAFAEGSDEGSLGGALVLTTRDPVQAANTVSNIGLLLRAGRVPGVTALGGKATGFTVRGGELGRKPLVVAAKGKRIAIGYGLAETLDGLSQSGATLSGSPAFKEAKAALGATPMSGFADGPAALRLVGSLIPAGERAGFAEARPYLRNVSYVAIGGESEGDLAKATLIVGLSK
jgi:hypothetical protein